MYPVIEIPADAGDLPEQLGTKPKFWFSDNRRLFKEVRPGTGEDWSEKVACELSALLGIPHANYELAEWKGLRGVVSENFLPPDGNLILGNQLLVRVDPRYPVTKLRGVRQHTLRVVLIVADLLNPPLAFQPFSGIKTAIDVFLGYLMLDAWIGNNDRHHENWGLVLTRERKLHLAPSYDHASSLGRIETEDEKRDRLATKDKQRTVEAYAEKAMPAFYASPASKKPLSPLEAFQSAARSHHHAALSWLKRLQDVSEDQTQHILEQVPRGRMSDVSKEFAQRILNFNRDRLLGLVKLLLK